MQYTTPRGTSDLLVTENKLRWKLQLILRELMQLYNYQEIVTPSFESYELFQRSVGINSDIVSKEMFTFFDKKNRKLVLRPENTAPIARAVIQNKLLNTALPLKLFYYGDMFRYERPQKNRKRQFTQFGVEVFAKKTPYLDAEIILIANQIINTLKVKDAVLKINFLGSKVTQEKYQRRLYPFLSEIQATLCADCQQRLNKNVLRVLDCKIDKNIKNLPLIATVYTPDERVYFEELKQLLSKLKIVYEVDNQLVRGLDYYNDLVFEIVSKEQINQSQNTLIGGGRYDNLVAELSGQSQPAIGFALGIDRLLNALATDNSFNKLANDIIDVFIVVLTADGYEIATKLLQEMRQHKFSCDLDYEQRSIKSQLNLITKYSCRFIIFIGNKELTIGSLTIKNQITKIEEQIPPDRLIEFLEKNQ